MRSGWLAALAAGLAAMGTPAAAAATGQALFVQHCSACHGLDGAGAPGAYPDLRGMVRSYFRTDAGRAFVTQLPLTGLTGKIQSGGATYFGAMPSFADLSNDDIAQILNFVSATLNGPAEGARPVTPDDIVAARKSLAAGVSTRLLRAKALQAGN